MVSRKLRSDRKGTFSGHSAERAIIDIGSNTVRLVVFGGSRRAPTVLLNEKVTARLGRSIAETGTLPDEAVALAMRGLRRYRLLLVDMEVDDVEVVATAATREASNGRVFLDEVRALGFEPRLIDGLEEARLSAQGVLGAFPDAEGFAADLGGGSLELIRIHDGAAGGGSSLPLGTLRLPDLSGVKPGVLRKTAVKMLKQAGWKKRGDGRLYLVGGSWRALAVAAMLGRKYPLTDPHGFELTADEATRLARRIARSDPAKLALMPRISSMRAATLPNTAILLQALQKQLQPSGIVFSSWGLREGLLFDRLDRSSQAQDPLLAGMAQFAELRGAPASLATRVAGWTAGLAPPGGAGSERLRLAATMLSLASMQVEPNLRLQHGVAWALYKRWIDLDAMGRAMIAAAISANGNNCTLSADIVRLAPEEALEEAIGWGLAIRLCRRIGGRSNTGLQATTLRREDDRLVLSLDADHSDLFGIPNEKDLAQLAVHLGLSPDVEVTNPEAGEAVPIGDSIGVEF